MTKKTAIILTGVPGSGKSTIAETLFPRHMRISSDMHIEEVAAIMGMTYNDVFKDTVDEATRVMNSRLDYAIKSGRDIVWDQTNLTPETRKKKLAKIPDDYFKVGLMVEIPWSTMWERNEARKAFGRSIPNQVLENMWNSIITPKMSEGYDVVFTNLPQIG